MTPFSWTPHDVSDAGLVAVALGIVRKWPAADAVSETSIELQARDPRIADAERFFHAARLLRHDSVMARTAQQLGAYIALCVMGWEVIDVVQLDAGATTKYVVTVGKRRNAAATERPEGVAFLMDANGHAVELLPRAAGGAE